MDLILAKTTTTNNNNTELRALGFGVSTLFYVIYWKQTTF